MIADSSNWAIGAPALTTSLRGVFDFYIEVRTLHHALHSGMSGGIVPDALMVLTRLLAACTTTAAMSRSTVLSRALPRT